MKYLLILILTGCSSINHKPEDRLLTNEEIKRVIAAFDEASKHAAETARKIDSGELK